MMVINNLKDDEPIGDWFGGEEGEIQGQYSEIVHPLVRKGEEEGVDESLSQQSSANLAPLDAPP